jgi:hypothetical protein
MDEQIRKSSLVCQVGSAVIGRGVAWIAGWVDCSFRLPRPPVSYACRGEATGLQSVDRPRRAAQGAGLAFFAGVTAVRQLGFTRCGRRSLTCRMVRPAA